ncbi:hypothetical protein Ancab_007693 [Ancistrocladus abbreviatus]
MPPKRSGNRVVTSVVRRTSRRVVSLIEDKGKEAKAIEQEERETQEEETIEAAVPDSQDQPKSIPVDDLQEQSSPPEKQPAFQAHAQQQEKPVQEQKQQQQEHGEQEGEEYEETQEQESPMEEPKMDKMATPPREEESPPMQEERQKPTSRPEEKPKKAEEEGKEKEKSGRHRVRKRRREGGEGYKRYVYRVLKEVQPGMGISSKAMTVVNNLMSDMFERLAGEASKLLVITGRRTMTSREIQGAVKLVLPGELGKHAIAEGSKAVSNYVAHDK